MEQAMTNQGASGAAPRPVRVFDHVRKAMAVCLASGLALLLAPVAAQAAFVRSHPDVGLEAMFDGDTNDEVHIFPEHPALGANSRYLIESSSPLEFHNSCSQPPRSAEGTGFCDRFGPRMTINLAGGNDNLNISKVQAGESSIAAGSGDDSVLGQFGKDVIRGSTGADELKGRDGDDLLLGEDQDDRLDGGDGNDRLDGGNGADTLHGESRSGDSGIDLLVGGDGNDLIVSREPDGTTSVQDRVLCGTGFDTVQADLKDLVPPRECEQIDRSPVGETPNVVLPSKVLDVSRSGVARVRLRCPRPTTIGCRGTLSLRLARRGTRRPAQTGYRIRAGRSATVEVQLTAAEARRVRGSVRGTLTSRERGRLGPKTTIRQPRLR